MSFLGSDPAGEALDVLCNLPISAVIERPCCSRLFSRAALARLLRCAFCSVVAASSRWPRRASALARLLRCAFCSVVAACSRSASTRAACARSRSSRLVSTTALAFLLRCALCSVVAATSRRRARASALACLLRCAFCSVVAACASAFACLRLYASTSFSRCVFHSSISFNRFVLFGMRLR